MCCAGPRANSSPSLAVVAHGARSLNGCAIRATINRTRDEPPRIWLRQALRAPASDALMTDNLLHHVAKAARDTENAWSAASTAGAAALQSAFTSLQTLEAQASPAAPPAAPNRMLSLQHDLEAQLIRLKTTLRRLTSIVNGLRRWQHDLHATTSYPALRHAFDELVLGVERDLGTKRDVLHSVMGDELFCLAITDWNRFIALWSEQPHRLGTCGHAVAAMAEAEQILQRIHLNQQPQPQQKQTLSPASSNAPSMSPAMLALKKSLSKSKT